MSFLISKLSNYNLFNYLLPGILFVFIAKYLTDFNLIQENNFIGGFVYYFIGMIISRFGSLVIEPFLKYLSFLKYEDYKNYVVASKVDEKIDLLSEVNNMYRTITSMVFLLIFSVIFNKIQKCFSISIMFLNFIVLILILLMFLFSLKKQSQYINKRIKANL